MVKPSKSFRKQAEKAEAIAFRSDDPQHADQMRSLADAFRAEADALKAAGKTKTKSKSKK